MKFPRIDWYAVCITIALALAFAWVMRAQGLSI